MLDGAGCLKLGRKGRAGAGKPNRPQDEEKQQSEREESIGDLVPADVKVLKWNERERIRRTQVQKKEGHECDLDIEKEPAEEQRDGEQKGIEVSCPAPDP